MVVGLIIYLPWLLITGGKEGLTDEQLINPLIVLVIIHLLILIFLQMVSDLAKSRMFEQDSGKALKAVWVALKLGFRKFLVVYPLGILLVLIPAATIAGFYVARSNITAGNLAMILIITLIQQIFILLRIFFRIWRLCSTYRCYLGQIQKS